MWATSTTRPRRSQGVVGSNRDRMCGEVHPTLEMISVPFLVLTRNGWNAMPQRAENFDADSGLPE
jgi:hypothetical protein